MPRSSKVSEVPQKQSLRGTTQLRTSSSGSVNQRPVTDRVSPKIGDRRSPRGTTPQSNAVNPKKFGTRVADLESQLGRAQDELKLLRQQITSDETVKKAAKAEPEKKAKKRAVPAPVEENQPETDVFEVSVEKVTLEPKIECEETKVEALEPEKKPSLTDLALKDDEISELKAKLEDKEKKLEVSVQENENLEKQLEEAALSISASKAKEDEMVLKLSATEEELEASKSISAQLKERLDSMQGEKEALEAEMKLLRVQTEQWRKQADVAAAFLSGDVEVNGRIPERCGSMDKHFGGLFEPPGYASSPGLGDDLDDGFGSGKRKGSSGIKMFGELWKKKGQK